MIKIQERDFSGYGIARLNVGLQANRDQKYTKEQLDCYLNRPGICLGEYVSW